MILTEFTKIFSILSEQQNVHPPSCSTQAPTTQMPTISLVPYNADYKPGFHITPDNKPGFHITPTNHRQ